MPVRPGEPPPITDDMRVAALTRPNSWLYVVDPAYDPDTAPPHGVVGAYPVDAHGVIERRWRPNRDYLPSPSALDMPEPATALERALQLTATGYRPNGDLVPATLDAVLLLYCRPADRAITGFHDRWSGRLMVPVCTTPSRVPEQWPGWRRMRGLDLVPMLAGHPVVVNPDGPITAVLPAEQLIAGARRRDPRRDPR